MFSSSQLLYMDEVLGTSPDHYRARVATTRTVAPAERPATGVVVHTPPLDETARALLTKILGSVKLESFRHVEHFDPEPCAHALHFGGAAARPGRHADAGGVTWGFHALDRMLGASTEVNATKREVWALLQNFGREI